MSDKKIAVPREMLIAALAFRDKADLHDDGKRLHINGWYIEGLLGAAVGWLEEELGKSEGISPCLGGTYQDGWNGAWRHIRRMFLAQPQCCERDNNGDGNCDIHSAPGVLRNKAMEAK